MDGSVERDNGNLLIVMTPSHFDSSIQSFAEKYGMGKWIYVSQAADLSDDPDKPTRFVCEMDMLIPQGDSVPVIEEQAEVELLQPLYVRGVSIADCFLKGKEIIGYDETILTYAGLNQTQRLKGEYKLYLS